MAYNRLINQLMDERNALSGEKDQVEAWDIMDAFDDPTDAIEWLREEIKVKKADRKYFRLTHEDMRVYENILIDDIYTKHLPAIENGADMNMKIIIGGRTMYIPMNAETFNALIEAVKECYKIENE